VCGEEEYICNSNTYQSPTKWVSSCNCKGLEDWFVMLFQDKVTHTHYIVLHDTANMKTDHVQQLMYNLCHLYCNWPGTIRFPAACQVSIVQDTSDWQECLYLEGLCFVKYLTFRFVYNIQTNDTSTQCILLDVKRQLHVLAMNGSHHQTVQKRSSRGNMYSAVCSLRPQTVYFCSTVHFFSTVYCTVWDIRLQIAAVNVAFLLSFINSLNVALFSSRNM